MKYVVINCYIGINQQIGVLVMITLNRSTGIIGSLHLNDELCYAFELQN